MFKCDHCGKKLNIQADGDSPPIQPVVDVKKNFIVLIRPIEYNTNSEYFLCLPCEKRIVMRHWKVNKDKY